MSDYGDATDSGPTAEGEEIRVLCVDDDPDYLDLIAAHLSDHGDFAVETETVPEEALAAVDRVDCVVSDFEMPGMDGLDLLAAVRERASTLPFVLFTGFERGELPDEIPSETWTEFLRKGDPGTTMAVLAGRIRRLVDHHRTLQTVQRSLTAIETTGDGIAVVAPDGEFTFVNRVFASHLSADPDDLAGRSWRTAFPDDEVDRLESSALRTVRDDWQWTGGCTLETDGGETVTAQTRVVGLDDGSLVFCLTATGDE
ncbi:MAG: response regulator [Halosimplex sp.]